MRASWQTTQLLAASLVVGVTSGCSSEPTQPSPATLSLSFVERTAEAGFGPTSDPGPVRPNFQRLSVIGGAAAGDVDNDGDVDLFVVSDGTGRNTLYVNRGDGTFRPASPSALTETPLYESGPLFVDYDGDGLLDIVMGGVRGLEDRDELHSVRVYRNLGGLSFADVSATAGITPRLELETYSITAADVTGDQRLELFLSHWGSVIETDETADQPLDTLHGGGFLWRNDGGGAFTDITKRAGLDDLTFTFTANFSDIDRDGDLDLLMASDFQTSKVLVNDGAVFRESMDSFLSDENGMGAAVGDYDRDGDMDWFVSSIFEGSGVYPDKSGNRLYRNDGSGRFTDVSRTAGVRDGGWGWASCFADFDNDGWLDLFHVNGWQREDPEFFSDRSRLFMSNGDGTFTEASASSGLVDDDQGRGVVCFDADRDGDIDIFVSNNRAPPSFYENESKTGNYLQVALRGPSPNTRGIGALVSVAPSTGTRQVREIRAGSNFVSQNPAEAHFGLADATSVDLSVRWPDGVVTRMSDVAANQRLVVSR